MCPRWGRTAAYGRAGVVVAQSGTCGKRSASRPPCCFPAAVSGLASRTLADRKGACQGWHGLASRATDVYSGARCRTGKRRGAAVRPLRGRARCGCCASSCWSRSPLVAEVPGRSTRRRRARRLRLGRTRRKALSPSIAVQRRSADRLAFTSDVRRVRRRCALRRSAGVIAGMRWRRSRGRCGRRPGTIVWWCGGSWRRRGGCRAALAGDVRGRCWRQACTRSGSRSQCAPACSAVARVRWACACRSGEVQGCCSRRGLVRCS